MKQLEWLSDNECSIDDVNFLCTLDDYSLRTNEQRFIILKDKGSLECYATVFACAPPRNIVEFGIFQGGSPTFFSLLFDVEKFVGIDLCSPVAEFDAFCDRHPIGRRIRRHYGVSQTDRAAIDRILKSEFGRTPPDVIIDDASHLYENTRRTFEIAFPHLRPGGMYVIEDWGWAHWPGPEHFSGETAMSKLIMELLMLCASRADLVSEIRVFPAFVFVRKTADVPPVEQFDLRSLYKQRGLEILGANGPDLARVPTLVLQSIRSTTRYRWHRFVNRVSRRLTGR